MHGTEPPPPRALCLLLAPSPPTAAATILIAITTERSVGCRTVDVGMPQLSMHSIREMAGVMDVTHAYRHFKAFYRCVVGARGGPVVVCAGHYACSGHIVHHLAVWFGFVHAACVSQALLFHSALTTRQNAHAAARFRSWTRHWMSIRCRHQTSVGRYASRRVHTCTELDGEGLVRPQAQRHETGFYTLPLPLQQHTHTHRKYTKRTNKPSRRLVRSAENYGTRGKKRLTPSTDERGGGYPSTQSGGPPLM
jgi:Aminopeptidase I zinc metalloprotease (M18)